MTSESGGMPEPSGPRDAPNLRKLEEAARSSAFGRLAEGGLSGRSLLAAMGGIRGLVETLLPGIVFLIAFVLGAPLWLAVVIPGVLGLVFVIVRAVQRQPVMPAVSGLVALLLSGSIALITGQGQDYYLVGLYTNAAYGLALLLSVVLGWPVIGLVAGALTGSLKAWRQDRVLKRWMSLATLIWVGFFALRLAVQLPLYLAGDVETLGVARLVMGVPMYAVLLVGTVLLVRWRLRVSKATSSVESGKLS